MLINGRPLSVVNVAAKANALIEGSYLGQKNSGTAMADVLFGDANPGGRIPITIARSVGQLPMFYNYKPESPIAAICSTPSRRCSSSSASASAPTSTSPRRRLSAATIRPDGSVTVSVDVEDHGTRAGDQVVQLCHQQVASVTRPVKELKGFQRVTLQPGESKTLTFTVGTTPR